MSVRRIATAAAVTGALTVATVLVPLSAAEAKSPRVIVKKQCGAIATKLKLSSDNGRIEAEYELDQNRNGRAWSLRMNDNGVRVASAVRTTRAPSGSFSWRVLAPNRAGTDTITVVATRGSTTCRITASL